MHFRYFSFCIDFNILSRNTQRPWNVIEMFFFYTFPFLYIIYKISHKEVNTQTIFLFFFETLLNIHYYCIVEY